MQAFNGLETRPRPRIRGIEAEARDLDVGLKVSTISMMLLLLMMMMTTTMMMIIFFAFNAWTYTTRDK